MLQPLSTRITIVNSVGLSCATVAVILRLLSRKRFAIAFAVDDVMISVALILFIPVSILNIYAGTTNAYDKTLPDLAGILECHKFAYFQLVLSHPAYGASKAAVILLCKRIFVTRKFALASNIMLVTLFMWTVTGTVGYIWSARPVRSWWTQILPAFIFNWKVFFIYLGASNMVLDIIIWLLPIILVIRKLQMNTRRKLLLSGIFALGLVCIITSAVRIYWATILYKVLAFEISFEFALPSTAWSSIWATIETTLTIVTACLPTFGPLFNKAKKSGRDSQDRLSCATLECSPTTYRSSRSFSGNTLTKWPSSNTRQTTSEKCGYLKPAGQGVSTCTAEVTDIELSIPQPNTIVVEQDFGYHREDFQEGKLELS